ncbi:MULTISPECIES: TetR family transcriptional regulator [unclassified Streptomyces]|uniref:TetR family transcriptional regulator n=1 Tax=unclassified Streptomyces TaxID=2593676 RepID=UPI002253805E|nr:MULTISPECIES: TetR family transcriptional regulator [unclassified Streptomyces]MCX5334443.1 TetR family transcriptional regulator [Streptomyces sp. NBC_00140]MCX5363952.1 TetR family transcriptional regulator [Streptomyces sp. NBC_00124]
METLRERKKQRTREALIRAALELFTTRGYDGTTVDDITEAVEVSQRTFFRYFANKEEAALAVVEMAVVHFIEAVRERPPHEAPLEAMRQAVLEGWDSLNDVIESVVPVELYLQMYRVIESTPVLLAAHLRRSMEVEETLARVIAEREGLDVAADPRPRLAVAVFSGVMRVTERQWSAAADFSLDAMRTLTVSYLEQVGPALTENWRTH